MRMRGDAARCDFIFLATGNGKPTMASIGGGQSGSSKPALAPRRGGSGPATLSPLLRHLRGLVVTVELKSGRTYRGILHETDNFMNCVIKREQQQHHRTAGGGQQGRGSSQSQSPFVGVDDSRTAGSKDDTRSSNGAGTNDDSDELPFDKVHIRGPLIRYIHLPPRADLARLIKDGVDRERRARDKYKRNVIRKRGADKK